MKRRLHALGIGVTILALVSLSTEVFASVTYTVRKGDTLWSISKRFRVSIYDIKRASGVSTNKPLPIGVKLTIPTADSQEAVSDDSIARFGPRVAGQLKKEAKALDADESNQHPVVRSAFACRGTRYVRGGASMRGFDCSGLTRYVFKKYGVDLPHYSAAQANYGKSVSRNELRAGDLVFFQTQGRRISHVGIYVGENKFVHAATRSRGVIVSSLNQPYYASRYRGARRVLKE